MAIKNGDKATTRGTRNSDTQGEWEKAKGFINISIPTAAGDKVRLVSVPLKESDPIHKQLLAWLSEEPTREGRLNGLTSKLSLSFNAVRSEAENQLALG
jgi:hypothetical protein